MEVLNNIWSIIAALIILSVMVMVHELGHFGMGRLFKFPIMEFAIGMGPKVFTRERNGTMYSIRALPIGGMCRFYGEDEAPVDTMSFTAQKAWKRFLVILGGPVMNLLFALLFAFISLIVYGGFAPVVHELRDGQCPAAIAGIEVGDVITAVNGKGVDYSNAVEKIRDADTGDIVITVERGGERIELLVSGAYDAEQGRNIIGITMTRGRRQYTFFGAVGGSVNYVGASIGQMFDFFGQLFKGNVQQGDVVGPVGTISFISYAVRTGLEVVIYLAVLLSVNLAVVNLLPLPALDGGRLVFIAIETIRGKPIPPEKEGTVHFVGIVLLMGLIVFLSYQDILAWMRGGY